MRWCKQKAACPRSVIIHGTLMYLIANSAYWVPFARVGLQVAGFLENIEYTCRVTERIRGNRLKAQQNLVNTNPCFLAASMRSTRPADSGDSVASSSASPSESRGAVVL